MVSCFPSGLSSPTVSSLMCYMWIGRRAVQWKGCLEHLVFLCWDRWLCWGWRQMWAQFPHLVQPLKIYQRFKCEEHIIVIFTFVYSLDWSCYGNGYKFDWPQRLYGGNGMFGTHYVLSSKYNIWQPPFTSWTKYLQGCHDCVSGIGCGSRGVVGGTTFMLDDLMEISHNCITTMEMHAACSSYIYCWHILISYV